MVGIADIGWGRYKQWEGPVFHGHQKYEVPSSPNDDDRILAVICATEGGAWDAYNGYDVCISTSGLIQWCERGQYSVSDMLGAVAEQAPALLQPVERLAFSSGLEFARNARGRWRFFFRQGHREVSTEIEQRRMFLLDSSGERGTWTDASRQYAKAWAAAISSVWQSTRAQDIQRDFTVSRMRRWFLYRTAKQLHDAAPPTDLGRAFQAILLSFAANNPLWAHQSVEAGMRDASRFAPYSYDWVVVMTHYLTFNPGVAIYPGRYNKIRPVVETLYDVDLPDFHVELAQWKNATGVTSFLDVEELQVALMALGYDLGPAGADGAYGKKTRAAVLAFEETTGIPRDHQDGWVDRYTVAALEQALEQQALDHLIV